MEINGPFIFSIQTDDTSLQRELHITFKPDFIHQNVSGRIGEPQDDMNQLTRHIQLLDNENPDRTGMKTMYQICENLLEYIQGDEIDLNETIVIEVQPTINIASFVTGRSTIN